LLDGRLRATRGGQRQHGQHDNDDTRPLPHRFLLPRMKVGAFPWLKSERMSRETASLRTGGDRAATVALADSVGISNICNGQFPGRTASRERKDKLVRTAVDPRSRVVRRVRSVPSRARVRTFRRLAAGGCQLQGPSTRGSRANRKNLQTGKI